MLSKWLHSGYSVWFVSGNFTKDDAVSIAERARSILRMETVIKKELSQVRCIKLQGHKRIDFELINEKNENSCLLSYF